MQFLVGDSALLLDPILGCESSLSLDTYQEKVRDEDVAQVAKDVGLAGACLMPSGIIESYVGARCAGVNIGGM